ncbi:uncharacterized protein LOC111330732 isoform X2 [Stylophora pistillata]|uniref:uncharacterized protein LOC111330732 isoform X2 n=1 Tax=Stylophora pistillata TaxID=50429 RepID=UPI000C0456F8|nr:uncharacterized protein LOC111330732 isoform X2 [Stylophora pistillata]
MSEKSNKTHSLQDVLLTLSPEKNLEGANSFAEVFRAHVFLKGSEENECYKNSIEKVLKFILKRMDNDQDQLIITIGSGDTCNKLTFPLLSIVSAYQSGETDFLERMARHYQYLSSGGDFQNTLGVVLILSNNYKMSETCFSEAYRCFKQQNNLLRTAVVTLNQAALCKVSGNYKKALSCCRDVVVLIHDVKRTKPLNCQVATRVLFRVANLLEEFRDYNSYHKILSIGAKCDADCIKKTFSVRYLKELMTLQLKEKEGKIKQDELDEFTQQLFSKVTTLKAELLNADFVKAVLIVAEMYYGIGCLEKAWNLIGKLERTLLNIHGGNCALYGFLLYQMGLFKVRHGEASEAQVTLLKAEEIFIHNFGRGYHMVASCKSLQGTCALLKGNQTEARHLLNEAHTQFEKIDNHHPEVGGILLKFAELESKDGNFENAKLTIEEALEIVTLACGKVSLQTALAYLQGASILQRKGEFMLPALDKVKKANDIFVYLGLPHDHPDVAFCHFLKGRLQFSLGQVKEAEEEFLFVHHQLSSQDELSMKTKVLAAELTPMFTLVDADGCAIQHSLCSHFLSLISLADMKTGDEKRGYLRELFSCFEGLHTEALTVSDYAGKHVHCKSQRISEADFSVNCILMFNSLLNPFQTIKARDLSNTHATPSRDEVFFSSPCSDDKSKTQEDYVYLLSPSSEDGKRLQLFLFWKTSKILEKQDLSYVSSSLQESVKLLCLQPKLRKAFFGEQEFCLKLPIQKQLPVISSLCSQIDCLPLLVELELSELHNHCFPTVSAVWPFAHVSYFSYSFFSSNKALLSFYKLISSLGRTLKLSEVLSISTPKVFSPSQMNCVVYFTFFDPICASLSLAVEEGSVHVKCRTVKNSGSTCICCSVKSALESTLKSLELNFGGSVFEPTLWLPCVGDGGEHDKEQARCYSHCKEFQKKISSSSDQNLDLHAQTKWEPNSGTLKEGPSVDLSQNEDTKSLLFTANSGDKIGIDVCVSLVKCFMRNRQLSLEVQPVGINNGSLTTDGSEEQVNSLLSPGLSLPLNCLPSGQYDAINEKQGVMQKVLPCLEDVHKETCSGKETGIISNTSSTSPAFFVISQSHDRAAEKSSCEKGLMADYHCSLETKDNLVPNEIPQETCRVERVGTCFNKEEFREDHIVEFDQSPGLSFATAGRENDKGTVAMGSLVCELQDEVVFYQDQCQELREELVKLKEKWKLCEDEKQDLQAEVGRQLFLESKERRCSKIYQPPSEHASGTIVPGRVRGASHDFSGTGAKLLGGAAPSNESGLLLQQRLQEISNSLSEVDLNQIKGLVRHKLNGFRLARIREGSKLFEELERREEFSCSFVRDLLERIHRFDLAEKLAAPFHNGNKSYRRESCSLQGSKQLDEVSESVSGVKGKQSDEVEERKDTYDNTEAYEEVQFCNDSNVHPFNSEREMVADTFHAEIVNESSFVGDEDLSKERCHSASGMFQTFDVPSIGVVTEDRSLSPSVTGGQVESGELKGACGAGDERGKEGSYQSSAHDGEEGEFNFNHHFNDTVDGVINLPDRAQDRSVPEDFTGVNQDSLSYGDKTQSQNVLSARIMAQMDEAIDQSDSYVGNQSNKWERLGARPRDRPTKTDRSPEPSFLYSLENLVPPKVAGPVAHHGVANAFLARHSEDKSLHESLYYTNAEMMFTENSSLQGASRVDGMVNLMNSNKANLNYSDCQFSSRQDSYHQPHSSLFPQTGGACIGGNNGSNTNFNLLNPNIANGFAPCTRTQDETFPYLQRDDLHSAFTGSGLTSDFMQTTGSQTGAFNMSNSNFSVKDYALGTREPQIPPDGHFASLHINQPIHPEFNGSGFAFDLTGTTGHEMTLSATVTHRNSDFSGSSSILPSTTNVGLLGTSSVNMQTHDYRPDPSPTAFSGARAGGSDNRLSAGLESSGSSQLLPVTTGRDVLNTSGQGNSSSNAMNTSGDCLASAHHREGSRAHNSSSSGLISGINTGGSLNQQPGQTGESVTNRNYGTESVESTDNSLLELEQRVEEACAMVERVLMEREEREEFGREIERKEHEIRAERARKKREREARELEEARGWPQQQEPVTGQSLWLCEHYQRHCRVRFPCCTNFYSCHRCHNNSKECDNEEAKASHATHLKCSYCHHEQEIAEDSAKCRSCGAKMSAYFCAICKHFTSIDKNPYHCEKCGICRIHKDKSFHCDVCNVCLDKRLQGKHKCRPDSGHDECCICLEDAFSGCQILPCSHKVHRECAIAMIQNGIRTCPVCRHPLYSPAPE